MAVPLAIPGSSNDAEKNSIDSMFFMSQQQDKEKFPIQFAVDDFVFIEKLTQSHNSTVWLVNYRFANDLLVLKEINFKKFMSHHWVNLRREFVSVRLHHENVLRTHGYLFGPNKVYFVQEHARGGDLYQNLKRDGPFPEDRVRKIIKQLLEAVKYIHSQNIIHRDLKLDNILLASANTDKILVADFGVCFPKTESRADPETKVGTLDYMAPEVLKDRDQMNVYDEKVDVWAVGIITYELLHGFPPFSNPDISQTCQNITQATFKTSAAISPECADFIKGVLQKGASKRPTVEKMQMHPWIAEPQAAKRVGALNLLPPAGVPGRKVAGSSSHSRPGMDDADAEHMSAATMKSDFLTHHVCCEILRRNIQSVLVMTDCPITRQLLSALLRVKKYTVVMKPSSYAKTMNINDEGVEAGAFIIDVGPYNAQIIRTALRNVLALPRRPILIALVTITQNRQPHVLADLFDYYIHKPVERTQIDVFPSVIQKQEFEGPTSNYVVEGETTRHVAEKMKDTKISDSDKISRNTSQPLASIKTQMVKRNPSSNLTATVFESGPSTEDRSMSPTSSRSGDTTPKSLRNRIWNKLKIGK